VPLERDDARLAIGRPYLDLLAGPVIRDNELVDQLLVRREDATTDGSRVVVQCLTLTMFCAAMVAPFDRGGTSAPRRIR
jgi:hypothetical protein